MLMVAPNSFYSTKKKKKKKGKKNKKNKKIQFGKRNIKLIQFLLWYVFKFKL